MAETSFNQCDVTSLFISCQADKSVLLVTELNSNTDLWLFCISNYLANFNDVYNELIKSIFGMTVPFTRVVYFSKIYVPNSRTTHLKHTCFQVPVNADLKKKTKFANQKKKIQWATKDDLLSLFASKQLKSPELLQIYANAFDTTPILVFAHGVGYNSFVNFVEASDQILVLGKTNSSDQMVFASNIDRYIQEMLLRDFIQKCFPAVYMSFAIFGEFVVKLGWESNEIEHLFRSADINQRNALSFRDLIYFLASIEPGIVFSGNCAEIRCRYIFRYLDQTQANVLHRNDMKRFFILLKQVKKMPIDSNRIEKEISDCYKTIKVPETQPLSVLQFLTNVGELKIRGTSQIYRSKTSIRHYVFSNLKDTSSFLSMNSGNIVPFSDYSVGYHCVTISKINKTTLVDELSTFTYISPSTLRDQFGSEIIRNNSTDIFDPMQPTNLLIKMTRNLIQLNRRIKPYARIDTVKYTWGDVNSVSMVRSISNVCEKVKTIVREETRLLNIKSPVYIIGDLHGNVHDLLMFENQLWPYGPHLCASSLLFLGDYVDRGVFSLEVMVYLFAYKVQNPKKIFLIRGNHEMRRIQINWTFQTELRIKFGDSLGTVVFEAINDVFDVLPLAAVIDGSLFCCHGGIPSPWLCPSVIAINDIPVVLNHPQEQSSLAWELMWNDPIDSNMINDSIILELMANEGFASNTRRKTGRVFTVEALDKFLMTNGFTHLIRAHEVAEAGFRVQQKGKSITVFSSSKYCNNANDAACILAEKGRLRLLRLNTEEIA